MQNNYMIEKITENIYLIDTLAYNEEKAVACYLVKSGDKFALIDVGYASTYMNVVNALLSANIDVSNLTYIIPTHVHLDHSGATGHIANIAKKATIVAHERAQRHLVDPSRLIESAKQIFGEEKLNSFGLPLPVNPERITVVKEELELKLGDLTLRCIYAPGHAPHQISVLLVEKKALFTADAVGIVQPKLNIMIPTTPPPSFDPIQAIKTVDNLSSHEPNMLLVPHFGVRNDPNNIFELTKIKINEWVEDIKKFLKENLNKEEILQRMIQKVKIEANLENLPSSAIQSIYVTVSGILNYLAKS